MIEVVTLLTMFLTITMVGFVTLIYLGEGYSPGLYSSSVFVSTDSDSPSISLGSWKSPSLSILGGSLRLRRTAAVGVGTRAHPGGFFVLRTLSRLHPTCE